MATDIVSELPPPHTRQRSDASSAPCRTRLPVLHDGPAVPDDPAVIVGLALAVTRQANGGMTYMPSVLLDRLDQHARQGNAACRTVLDHVTRHTNEYRLPLGVDGVQSALGEETCVAIIAAPNLPTTEGK